MRTITYKWRAYQRRSTSRQPLLDDENTHLQVASDLPHDNRCFRDIDINNLSLSDVSQTKPWLVQNLVVSLCRYIYTLQILESVCRTRFHHRQVEDPAPRLAGTWEKVVAPLKLSRNHGSTLHAVVSLCINFCAWAKYVAKRNPTMRGNELYQMARKFEAAVQPEDDGSSMLWSLGFDLHFGCCDL